MQTMRIKIMNTRLQEPNEEILERICDAHWNRKGEGVVFHDIFQHNACNHTLSGEIEHEGHKYGFIIQNGDWNGTVVDAWGDSDEVGIYEHPKPTLFTFLPRNHPLECTLAMLTIYFAWRNEKWFSEKIGKYMYDRHFQPGGKIESYYREFAERKGMRIGIQDEVAEYENAFKAISK